MRPKRMFVLLLALVGLVSAATTAVALQPYLALGQWGTTGSGSGQFQDPSDVSVDPSGNVFVVDQMLGKVQRFTTTGAFVSSWTKGCKGCTSLSSPGGVAAGSNVVWVADTGNQRLVKFSSTGVQLLVVPTPAPGQPGAFSTALDVDLDTSGNVYVASGVGKPSVQVFSAAGAYVRTLTPPASVGSQGTGAVTVDSARNVYALVTPDLLSLAIVKWDSQGVATGSFGIQGSTGGAPGLTIDSQNRLYAGGGSNKINVYSTAGTLLGSFGTSGSGPLQFNNPEIAAPDTFDVLYVADRGNDRIQRIAESSTLTVRVVGLAQDVVPGATFTVTGPTPIAPFTLDDASATPTPDSRTTSGLVPGSYVVQNPANVSGHLPTSVSCSNGQSAGAGTTNMTVTVKAGASVTCTYTYTWVG